HSTARSIWAGEIDALLDLDAVAVGAKRPHLPVRLGQHGAVPVGQPVGLNRWMQVEAHGELIAIGRNEFSACWRKQIFAVEPAPVGRKHEQALVDDVENLAVTVMRNAQDGAIPLLLT